MGIQDTSCMCKDINFSVLVQSKPDFKKKIPSYKDTYLVLWSEPACMMLALWFVTHRTTKLT